MTTSLTALRHPIVQRAQNLPHEVEAGGAERVRSLSDRVWFKCKSARHRAVVTRLAFNEAQVFGTPSQGGGWWIGAAGERRDDSATDFYRRIKAEADRHGRGTGASSTAHLLPQPIDWQRLEAELAALAYERIRALVRILIVRSLRCGRACSVDADGHRVTALVHAEEGGDAYLAVFTEGFLDPRVIALILSAVPGIREEDWQPEPGGVAGIQPAVGQIVWSTIIPVAVQRNLLEEFPVQEEAADV